MVDSGDAILVFGYPDFLARRLTEKLLAETTRTVVLLVNSNKMEEANELIKTYQHNWQKRIELLEGEISAIDFGLSGAEYLNLLERVRTVYHAALSFQIKHTPRYLHERNVRGTKRIVEFCEESPRVERLFFLGSVHVSGTRKGLVREGEFYRGQTFKSFIESTFFKAEQIVRAVSHRVAITVFRLGNIIGDSHTGEIGEFEGPYALLYPMLAGTNQQIVLPGSCSAKSNIVPIDFAINAIFHISQQESSIGQTYHIVDPYSPPVHRVFKLVASYLGVKSPTFGVPIALHKALFSLTMMRKRLGVPYELFSYFNHNVEYSTTNTQDALQGSGIECPEFETYFPIVIEYAERRIRDEIERREELEIIDPLEAEYYKEEQSWQRRV